jgi:D-glycero-alpha-D-manno-heptose-7-phosphate kinase
MATEMQEIRAKAPTRVDLAGGTLDLWPLYTFFDGATTINVAIDIFTYANLRPRSDGKIKLTIADTSSSKSYSSLKECLVDSDPQFTLLREHVRFWSPDKGFELETRSESPIGGGLGGSSSLSISLLGAFSEMSGRKLSTSEIVTIASNIEAKVLNVPTGTQDYYPAVLGGLNFLKYTQEGCKPEKRKSHGVFEQIRNNFILVYTGKPHQSGLNNWEVLKQSIERRGDAVKALAKLKSVADDLADCLESESWPKFKDILNAEYDARVWLSKVFSSPEIERLKELTLASGAEAVKICGAGGGGCVVVWCGPQHRERVIEKCQSGGFQVLNARPVEQGLEVVKQG